MYRHIVKMTGNMKKKNGDIVPFLPFFLPNFITEKLGYQHISPKLIVSSLTVCTSYASTYTVYGFFGMYFMYWQFYSYAVRAFIRKVKSEIKH